MTSIQTLFPALSLVPVVVIDHAEDAVPLAHALLEGGITSIEITLRTDAGLPAIEAVARHVPEIILGSGTVTNAVQLQAAHDAGAQFHVSPGITESLARAAQQYQRLLLPGTVNASQIMLARDYGMRCVKFFPASLSGGAAMLKQFGGLFPDMHFCPTGGITQESMHDYAALPNVFLIGGSWLTPKEALANKDWARISRIAAESVAALRQ